MKNLVKLLLLVSVFLYGTATALGQCNVETFTLTTVAGTCASDAKINVQADCKGSQWEAVLLKAGREESTLTLDNNGAASFQNLVPAAFQVKIRKKDGTQESSLKSVTTTTSYVYYSVAEIKQEAPNCQLGKDGKVSVAIRNTTGAGPYKVELLQGGVVVASSAVTPKSGASGNTVVQVIGSNTNPVETGTYEVRIIDYINNKAGCYYAETGRAVSVDTPPKNPEFIAAFYKPKCANCNKYEVLIAMQHDPYKSHLPRATGTLKVRVTNGGTLKCETTINTATQEVQLGTPGLEIPFIQYNNWRKNSYDFFKGVCEVEEGDSISLVFDDNCPATADITADYTVNYSSTQRGNFNYMIGGQNHSFDRPITDVEEITNGACQRTGYRFSVGMKAHRGDTWNYWLRNTKQMFSMFCESTVTMRLLKKNTVTGNYDVVTGTEKDLKVGDFVQGTSDLNPDGTVRTTTPDYLDITSNGDYRIEVYTKSNVNGVDKTPCKYFSKDISINTINNSATGALPERAARAELWTYTVLEGTSPGLRILYSGSNSGGMTYTTGNPLDVEIKPTDGRTSDTGTINGPLSMGQTYTITYPIKWVKTDNIENHIYDLPPGEYEIKFSSKCLNRTQRITIPSNPAIYKPKVEVIGGCRGGAIVKYDLGANSVVEAIENHGARLFRDKSATGATGVISFAEGVSRRGAWVTNYTSREQGVKGTFLNIPPGRYILHIYNTMNWYNQSFTVFQNPTNGYATGEQHPAEDYDKIKGGYYEKPFIHDMYYAFEVLANQTISLSPMATLCDPQDPTTGVIGVEIGSGTPSYPITYQLWVQNKTTLALTRAKDNTGTEVPDYTIASAPPSGSTYHAFNKLPRLNYTNEEYVVRLVTPCNEEGYPIPDFDPKSNTDIIASGDNLCPNTALVLDIGLPANVYNFTWHSSIGNIPSSEVNKKRITIYPTQTAEYWVVYQAKDASICGSINTFTTNKKTITVKADNTPPAITSLSGTTNTVLPGDCTFAYSWTTPTITDAEGCLKSVTWRVENASGTKIHPTTGENDSSVATSWQFPIGVSKVVYTATDTAGNSSTMSFNVTVNPSTISLNVSNGYFDAANAPKTSTAIGETIYYKVTLQNAGNQNLRDVSLVVTLPNNANVTLPTTSQVNISDLAGGTTPNVAYDATAKTYTITNLSDALFTRNSTAKNIIFPIVVKGNCGDYGTSCLNALSSNVVVTFSGGSVSCPIVGQTANANSLISVDTSLRCLRQELYCGVPQVLNASGTGYDSYQWYLNGSPLVGATGSSYTATSTGVYRVARVATCSGTPVTSTEEIHLLDNTGLLSSDPIKAQSNGGATCGDTGQWVSHFFLCDGSSKTLAVTFNDSQKLSWQSYKSSCTVSRANCQSRDDSCWTETHTGQSFTLSNGGHYRLRVTGNGCTQDFYFTAYTTGLGGVVTATHQDDNNLGSVVVTMDTTGKTYTYILKEGGVEKQRATVTNHQHTFGNLQIPEGGSVTYTVEVTSSDIPDCKLVKTVVVEDKKTMKARVEFRTWVDCADGNFAFTVTSGRSPYRVAIYSIDGVKQHPSASNLEHIPDAAFTAGAGTSGQEFVEKFAITTPGGYYVFVVRDSNGQNSLTNSVQIPHNPNFQTEILATDIKCSDDRGTITARFLPSLNVPQTVKLYKDSVSASNLVGQNNSGTFTGLQAGNYVAVIATRTGKVCEFTRTIEVKRLFEPLVGFVGVQRDILCDPTKGYKVSVNNVSGGKAPYTYSFSGGNAGTFGPSNVGFISNSMSIFVEDANGCKLELPVVVDPALQQPTVPADLHSLISYDCEGNARFTITPVAPSGKTYTYEYELDGNSVTNTFVLPPKAGGASYTINIYYKDASAVTTQSNLLFKEDFGTGADACYTGVNLVCRKGEPLIDGTHNVTSNLLASSDYAFPAGATASGRYLAMAGAPNQLVYTLPVKNLIPSKKVFVKFRYINLLKSSAISKTSAGLKIRGEVNGGFYERTLPALPREGNWSEVKLEFNEFETANHDQVVLWFVLDGNTTNTAIAIDDIEVYQETETCRVPITRTVTPLAGKGFNPVVVDVQDAKCRGDKGQVFVEVTNNGGATSLPYSLDGGVTWLTANLVTGSTTRYRFEALAGVYQVKFKRDDCVITAPASVTINEPSVVSLPSTGISATQVGCVAPFLTSTVTLTVQGGTRPYQSVRYREQGSTAWVSTGTAVSGDKAVVSGLQAGKTYEFTITDANNCSLGEVMGVYTIPSAVAVTMEVTPTRCYIDGQGEIKVKVLTGVGPYKFSKDNGVTFEYNPDDINADNLTYEGLDAGTYTIVVEDALGCKETKQVTIYPRLTLQLTTDGAFDCSATATEKVTLEANGGKGVHSFRWKRGTSGAFRASTDTDGGKVIFGTPSVVGGRTKVQIDIKEAGEYYFEVSDENVDEFGVGCLEIQAVEIKVVPPAWQNGLVLSSDEILCEGASTGMIGVRQGGVLREINLTTDIDGTKGVAPYTILVYKKIGGVVDTSTEVGTRNLPAGLYVVRLRDSKNCVSDDVEVRITEKRKVNVVAVKTADVDCTASGTFNYGKITASWTTGGTAPFTASLYTSTGVLARRVTSGGVHQYTGRGAADTIIFDELVSGTYTVVLVDANGCRVEATSVTIDGLATNVKVEPQTATCTTASVKLIAYNEHTAIDPTKVKFAIYKGGNPASYPLTAWTPASAGTYVVGGSSVVSAEGTITGLLPGISYRFVISDNGCYSFTDAVAMQVATTTKVDAITGLVACTGADGKVRFKLTNIPTAVTSISYQIYNYPANTTVGAAVSLPVSGGALEYEETANTLVPGEYYVVFTESGAACTVASKPFTIEKPDVPLSVTLALTKNETCTDSAQLVARVTGGKSGYKYIFKNSNALPTATEWTAETAVLTTQKELKTGVHLASTLTGRWYVFVQDANGCVSQNEVQIVKDNTPQILSVTEENLCASNGNYHLRVVMSRLGAGQHYYRVTRNGVTSSLRPIAFTLNGSGQYEFVVTNLYSDANLQQVEVVDINRCASGTVNFNLAARLSYEAKVTKKLTCNTPSDAEITLNNFSRAVAYQYKVHSVVTQFVTDPMSGELVQQETETEVIALTAGSVPQTTFGVSSAGKYRIYVYETSAGNCPIVQNVIVNPKELPIVSQVSVVDESCPLTATVGAGTGKITVSAGSVSIGGFSFAIVKAVDLTNNSTITGIPATYTTATSTSIAGVVEIDGSGMIATYEGLKGTPQGVRYHIVATSLVNGCTSLELQVTVQAPMPIEVAANSVSVTQFACDSYQELQQAKIALNTAGVSGGTAPYIYVFKKAGVEVQRSKNAELLVYDKSGGSYTIEVVDANGCVHPEGNTYVIQPFVSMESITSAQNTMATCSVGESIDITITTDPAAGTPTNGFTYRVEKSGVLKTSTTNAKQVTITDLEVGVYKITVRNNDTNCEIYSSYEVQDPNTFVVTASNPKRVTCFGGSDGEITLTFTDTDLNNGDQAATGFSYKITNVYDPSMPPITGTVTGATTTVVTGLSAGTYKVEATSTTNCTTKMTSQFSIRQAYEALSGRATMEYEPTCTNDQGEILVSVLGGVTPYSITITGTNGTTKTATDVYDSYLFTGLGGGNTPGSSATYTVVVTDEWGCSVTLTDQPVLNRPADIVYTYTKTDPTCVDGDNGSITLTSVTGGSGAGTYYYELQGITNSRYYLQRNTTFTGLVQGTYKLTITDRWGCQESTNITLSDPSKVVIREVDKSEALCFEDTTGFITVQISGGTPGSAGYEVELVNSRTGIMRGHQTGVQPNTDVTFTGLSPEIGYEIRVVDSQGCRSRDVHSFELVQLPDLTAKITYSESCVNNLYEGRILVEFSQTLDWSKVRYAINSTNLSDSKAFDGAELNVAYVLVDASTPKGDQTMTLFYVQPSALSKPDIVCSKESNKYFVRPHQVLALERDERYELVVNEIKVQGKFGVEPYRYYFNGQYLGDSSVYLVKRTDPEAVEPTTGRTMKYILARVEDHLGCVAELPIYYEYLDIHIPNFFTPTGDGTNDGWSPEYTTHYPHMLVSVYDRYGRLIVTLRQGQKWDGRYNGKELPSGDYWYILQLNSDEDPRQFKGHFTLYR